MVLQILLPEASSSMVTDAVFENACGNDLVMALLLKRRKSSLPMERMLQNIGDEPEFGASVLQILLGQDLVTIKNSAVEILARNCNALRVLLFRKPNVPIQRRPSWWPHPTLNP